MIAQGREQADPFMILLQCTVGDQIHAGKDCFFAQYSMDTESILSVKSAWFFIRPTEIFMFIAKPLGISFGFCYVMAKTPSKPFLMEDLSCRLSVWTTQEQDVLQRIEQVLPQQQLQFLAYQTKAVQRQRKIKPIGLLGALCLLTFHGCCSLRMSALFTGILSGCLISKQAFAQRINEYWVLFFAKVLGCTLARMALSEETKSTGIFSSFKRVLLHDSTKVALPQKLAKWFPGARNQTRKHNAMISLQVIVNLVSETFIHFGINPFTYNDQRAARDILDLISPGDLVIRDLGYFVLRVFRAIINKQAYLLSRYQHGTYLATAESDKFDLLATLKKTPLLDRRIYLGKEEKIPIRLVALPVPEQVANERRRKLRNNRDRRLKPTNEQLALCGWVILITNVPETIWSTQDVSNAYGIRWRIGIIFKAWKSHFNLNQLPNGSKEYIQILFYVRLIFISLFQVTFMRFDRVIYGKTPTAHLSLLKFAQLFSLFVIMAFGPAMLYSEILMSNIEKHCAYEKRCDRLSYGDITQILLS